VDITGKCQENQYVNNYSCAFEIANIKEKLVLKGGQAHGQLDHEAVRLRRGQGKEMGALEVHGGNDEDSAAPGAFSEAACSFKRSSTIVFAIVSA
jgi:hypothetical protein